LFFADELYRFIVSLLHNGLFYGMRDNLEYIDRTLDFYDNCYTETFSLLWIQEFVGREEMKSQRGHAYIGVHLEQI
jgi:hypothetical protein